MMDMVYVVELEDGTVDVFISEYEAEDEYLDTWDESVSEHAPDGGKVMSLDDAYLDYDWSMSNWSECALELLSRNFDLKEGGR